MSARDGMRIVPQREDTAQENNRKVRRRATWLLALYIVLAVALVGRLAWLQLVKGDEYGRMAYVGQTRQQQVKPKRGSIYDRNGKALAISAQVDTVSVNPILLREETLKNPEVIPAMADEIAKIIGMKRDDVYAKLTSSESFATIARKIDKEKGASVRAYLQTVKIGSVFVDADSKRFYPKGSLAAHVIGFTGTDDQGLLGIEKKEDGVLKGEAGRILSEVDAKGNPVSFDASMRLEPKDGYDITLTLDETIQDMTEKALAGIITQWNVKNGASAIAMDPATGEVLAMASLPDFDPNAPGRQPAGWTGESNWIGFNDTANNDYLWSTVFRNKAVMDTYEPGSTYKSITAAAGLELGLVSPETQVVDAPFMVAGAEEPINCWKVSGHGAETFREAVYNSCNPVFTKLSLQIGIERFYNFARLFGLMEQTGIEIEGESNSIWHEKPMEIDMAVAAFGQRFQVTPIQMITAYTAIANGGSLMKPTIIRQISDSDGILVKKFEPEVVRKVISPQTSETVRSILEGVVSEGTGKSAYISGYRMAGKTGTSETTLTETEGRYIVSFMSFAPADNPKVCLLIEVDWPQTKVSGDIGGGKIVAPVAGRLMEQILSYQKEARDYSDKDKEQMAKELYLPDVMDESVESAKTRLKEYGFNPMDGTTGQKPADLVTRTSPAIGGSVPQGSVVYLYSGKDPVPVTTTVPNLSGRTVDEAKSALARIGLNLRIIGSGSATAQEPVAATVVEKGEVVGVQFQQAVAD